MRVAAYLTTVMWSRRRPAPGPTLLVRRDATPDRNQVSDGPQRAYARRLDRGDPILRWEINGTLYSSQSMRLF